MKLLNDEVILWQPIRDPLRPFNSFFTANRRFAFLPTMLMTLELTREGIDDKENKE